MRLRRIVSLLALCTLLLTPQVVGASSHERSNKTSGDRAAAAGTEACGHLGEMSAAREALASGDRQLALRHLKAARTILVECERRAGEADPGLVEIGQGRAELI